MLLGYFSRSLPLALLSLVEYGTPLLRMLALSRILDLSELGFAAALTATYGAYAMVTDFGTYRFVLSAPREDYEEALASAHALMILRGAAVAIVGVAIAPLIAAAFSLTEYWGSFALVAIAFFIQCLEHIGPRVAERDYRYGVQLRATLIANAAGLTALLATLMATHSHKAIIAFLFAHQTTQVIASHALAASPYRVNFRSSYFRQAFRFGYPLMFNGLGLAAASQGDRFIVGSLLGLPTLGLYSVATLVTQLPLNMIFRFVGTFLMAALYNVARRTDGSYAARMRFAARLLPLAGAVFALAIVSLLDIFMPLLFGKQFTLPLSSISLLALAAFIRLARFDPFTSMLLVEGRTRRLALINLSSATALVFEFVLIKIFRTFDAVLLGRLMGELTALAMVVYVTRAAFRPALADFTLAMSLGATAVLATIGFAFAAPIDMQLAASMVASVVCVALIVAWVAYFAPPLVRAGFSGAAKVQKAEEVPDHSARIS